MDKNELLAQLDACETLEEAKAIRGQLEAAAEREALAEEKKALFESLSTTEEVEVAPASAKTLGEFAAKNLDVTRVLSGDAKSAATPYGFKAATDVHTSPQLDVLDQNVVSLQRELTIRDLFGAETISGNALTYYVLGETEGAPSVVAQGGLKPQIHVPYEPKTEPLVKIAAWFKESDELLADAAFLESAINARGVYEHNLFVEGYLVSKLLATSGIQTDTGVDADGILKNAMGIREETGYAADALVINPTDYAKYRVAKDSNLQYYGGGYFYGPYGNMGVTEQPGLWGLRTVVTPAVEAGTAIVGAFKAGGSVVTKAGEGLRVEVATENQDDFVKNCVTVLIEERLLLATRVPAAFCKLTLAE